jgi:hypothetical protein
LNRNKVNLNLDFPASLDYRTTVLFYANDTTYYGLRYYITGIESDNIALNNTSNTLIASISILSSAKFNAVKITSFTYSLYTPEFALAILLCLAFYLRKKKITENLSSVIVGQVKSISRDN